MRRACAALMVDVCHCSCFVESEQDVFATDEWMEVAKNIEDCLQLQDIDVAPLEMWIPNASSMMRKHEGVPPEKASVGCYTHFSSWQR